MDADAQHLIAQYVQQTAPIIVLQLNPEGEIVDMNQYAQTLLQHTTANKFMELIVNFDAQNNWTQFMKSASRADAEEQLFTLSLGNRELRSAFFRFVVSNDAIWVFGREDQQEIETLGHEIYTLNQQLGTLSRELQKKNASLQHALDHVKTLQGILPICMHCHKIRNDKDVWDQLELYIESHTDAEFSHSICNDCLEKLYPEEDDESL
ncbi:MAG: hypothetical protein JXX29_13715 [Deltaproteobacteria bacterium]|nr:hypothetical protein [Deltaproteobacteria bacterium]MBN2672734.1 hypothetical protein [Deltaproteobacteria bacterium]